MGAMTLSALVFALALQGGAAAPAVQLPEPKPEDVKSLDAIVKALYDVISGPAGQKRDWNRFRSLFAPNARMTALVKRPNGELAAIGMSPEDYIARSGKMLEERGFFEIEVKRQATMVEDMAMLWSDYESRHKPDDPKPFQTGTNGIQAYTNGKRWFLLSVLWQGR